jgi:diguanylate cyclase (GGDEF)-like protein
MAQLVFIEGKSMGSSVVLQDNTTLGRLPENGIPIPHSSVSDRHATIVHGVAGWKILCATPEARVVVNGQEIQEHLLRHGDVLTIGQMTLIFNDDVQHAVAKPPAPPLDADPSRFVYRHRHVEHAEEAVTTIRKGKRAAEHLETLYKVGADLNASLRLSDLTASLLTQLVKTFKADRCFLLLQDARGQLTVRDERINEASKKQGSTKLSKTMLAETVGRREAIRVEDALADSRVMNVDSIRQMHIQSALAAPMIKGERIIGAILLDTVSLKRPWNDEDLHLLDAIAAQASSAIEVLQQLDREVGFGKLLLRLGESARRLTSSLSGEVVLTEAVAQACAIFDCSRASVLLADPSGSHLSVSASNCIDRALWPTVKILPGEGFAGRVFRDGRSLLSADAPSPADRGYQTSSCVVTPIFAGGERPLGVLTVTDKTNKGHFTARDEELLSIFASQVGIALANARLYERATTDALTKLSNRHHFDHQLDETMASCAKQGRPFTVFMCDLDHFKQKNDTYGHQVGDRVLVEAATIIKQRVGTSGLVGRYGGEEFLVMLPGLTPAAGREIADDARRQIEEFAFNAPEQPIRSTVSIGVAGRMPDEKAGSMIKRADAALYTAKHTGRNKVEVAPEPT